MLKMLSSNTATGCVVVCTTLQSLLGGAFTELGHCELSVVAELLLAVVLLMTLLLGVTTSRNSFGSRSSSIFFICCSRIVKGNRKCIVRKFANDG
ncbi:hypothetical protein TYRP_022298 [Tyrophagus putrescentiae]|nr:hypothetical protein TYRP_022298 [Tyrophagus putrescentiae]